MLKKAGYSDLSTEQYQELADGKAIVPDMEPGPLCGYCPFLGDCPKFVGEEVPELSNAAHLASTADIFIIVGTSLQVYPAAGLMQYTPQHCQMYYVDPNPFINHELKQFPNLEVIKKTAVSGLPELVRRLINENS